MNTVDLTYRRICKNCRYWSEMLARARGGSGTVTACCLSDESPFFGQFQPPSARCEAWKSGHCGAIDDPRIKDVHLLYKD